MSKVLGPESRVEKDRPITDEAGVSTRIEKVGLFASLHIRNYRFLLGGTLLSNAAGWIQSVGLSWLIYNLTGSGTILGTINMVQSATSLGMLPMSGVLVDRVGHRKLLVIKNAWLFTITLGLGSILLFGDSHISYLFIFAFLCGLIQSLDKILGQVVIFDLVPRVDTPNAVALLQILNALVRSLGPAIGGFLILWFGPGGNFIIQAGAYALVGISIIQIQFPAHKSDIVRGSPLQNIREGIRYVAKARVTRTFMLMGFVLPLFTIPIVTILPPIYAVKVFHGGADVLGILLASVGVGGIFGGVVTAYLSRLERWGLVQLASIFLLSLSLIAFAFSTKLWIALLFLSLGGFFEVISIATNQTLLQLSIPDDLRGRVTSVITLNAALGILSGLVAGVGSDLLGGPKMITIVFASIAASVCIFVFLFSSTVRNYRLSQGISSNSTTKRF